MSSPRAFYFPDSTRPTFQIHFDEKTHWETWPELPHLDASTERWGLDPQEVVSHARRS